MKGSIAIISFLIPFSFCLGEEIFFEKIPWTGDWLPLAENIMVQGDGFYGYPGPLAKLGLSNLGHLSFNAIDFEERYLVDPTQPLWFGNCDGWAAAALLYGDPEYVVTNGVKLLQPEMRALYSVSRADDNIIPFGAGGGLSAQGFHSIVENFFRKGYSIIFDMALSEEKWNYPVAGYERSESTDEDGTVHVAIKLIMTLPLAMKVQLGLTITPFYETLVKYKYTPEQVFEWESGLYPEFAWLPGVPFFQDRWDLHGNRFITKEFIEEYTELADQNLFSLIDQQEPNNELDGAFKINSQVLLGCTSSNDPDYYNFIIKGGLPESVELVTYDGPDFNWIVRSYLTGEAVSEGTGDFTFISASVDDGKYSLEISSQNEGQSFYVIRLPEGSMFIADGAAGIIVNYKNEEISYHQCDAIGSVLPLGSKTTFSELDPECDAFFNGNMMQFYGLDSEQAIPYYVRKENNSKVRYFPHIAHLNDWTTEILVEGASANMSFEISIYDKNGLEVKTETFTASGFTGRYPLSTLVQKDLPPTGYWFSIREVNSKKFHCEVLFARGDINKGVSYVLNEYRECFGEFLVSDILTENQGWNGIALVNTSNVDNQIMYKVIGSQGEEKIDGSFTLAPHQKHLDLAHLMLKDYEIQEGDFLRMFSQYPIVGIQISTEYPENIPKGDFLTSQLLDYKSVTAWPLVSGNFEVINRSNRFQHVLFTGYDQDGVRVGRFNTDLGHPLSPFSRGTFSISQILDNGVLDGDVADISHFVIAIPESVYLQYNQPHNLGLISYQGNSPLPYLGVQETQKLKDAVVSYDVLEMIK